VRKCWYHFGVLKSEEHVPIDALSCARIIILLKILNLVLDESEFYKFDLVKNLIQSCLHHLINYIYCEFSPQAYTPQVLTGNRKWNHGLFNRLIGWLS
jgi:hypothetical protein